LTPLESRKQLLLVESEVNRAQLASDWAEFRGQISVWKDEIHTIGSTASSVFTGVKAISGVIRNGKSSLASTLFNVARSGLSMWGRVLTRVR